MLRRKTSQFHSTTFLLLLLMSVAPALSPAQEHAPKAYAAVVYVVGAVNKPGGYVLQERETLTILKALDLSGGLSETAAKGSAKVIRRKNGAKSEIPVDLNKVLQGKARDLELVADDVLFVPEVRKPPHWISPYYDPPPTLPPLELNRDPTSTS